jgi:hypothetical protein
MIKHFMFVLIQIIVCQNEFIRKTKFLCFLLALHLIGSNLSIQQTIGGINHMFLPQQASLPAGKKEN